MPNFSSPDTDPKVYRRVEKNVPVWRLKFTDTSNWDDPETHKDRLPEDLENQLEELYQARSDGIKESRDQILYKTKRDWEMRQRIEQKHSEDYTEAEREWANNRQMNCEL